ncbi:MAG TPA: hypothetical protein VM935_14740 [Chitinophagaceae bacterium]|nr:hypothetical protein [Chitinophagaceae bacterium]
MSIRTTALVDSSDRPDVKLFYASFVSLVTTSFISPKGYKAVVLGENGVVEKDYQTTNS